MGRLSAFVVTALAFIFVFSSMLLAQEYAIRLSREGKSGEKYRLSTTGRHAETMTVFVGDVAVNEKNDQFSVELVSSLTVIETDENGRSIRQALGIEKCLITTGGITKPLLPPGIVVIATTEGKRTVLKINDLPVDPMTAKALSVVIPSYVSGLSDDDVFGTREKKRIGDTWEINADLAARSLKEEFNVSTNKGDVKGASTLEGAVKGAQEGYLIVSAWLNVDDFSLPLPEGVKIQNGQVRSLFSGKFPINEARAPLGVSAKMMMSFTAIGPPDPKTPQMLIQGAMERSLTRELAPLE